MASADSMERNMPAGLEEFMRSLGQLESGNRYDIKGPTHSTYGTATGRFQIMSKIYPGWAREAGVNPNDWSPAAQDKVARHKMSEYYRRYGNWDLVAVAWFSGPARADKAKKQGISSVGGIKDSLGTSVSAYVSKVRAGMKSGSGQAPSGSADSMERQLQQRQGGGAPSGGAGFKDAWGNLTGMAGEAVRRAPMQQGASQEPASPWGSPLGQQLVGPMEAAPGATLTEAQESTRDAQMGQDTLGAIMGAISDATRSAGGGILDARSLFGMPNRPVEPQAVAEPVVADLGEPKQPEARQAPAPSGPMAEPPKHDGFAPLKDHAKAGAQRIMGQFPGLRFTSGYRDPKRNAAANGVKNSKHLTGEATDFVGSEKEMQAAAAAAKAAGAKKTLIRDSGSGRHLHIEW